MKILLADDHHLVRDALATLLQNSDPEVEVITAQDLPGALGIVQGDADVDITILDLRMPGMNGLAGLETIVKSAPGMPVVILSGSASRNDVNAALRLGAKGFLPKTLAGKSLLNAIRLVASGEIYVPPDLMARPATPSPGPQQAALSVRELEVLEQLRGGHPNKTIAHALDISETTVKMHIRSLSQKLCARNRTEIVIKALETQIL